MEINLCMFDIFNPGASVFLESPSNFSGPKSCFMLAMFAFKIKVSVILKMILVTMKLPVNEAKLTSLWARNFATIQQVLILKFAFRSERYWAFRETVSRKTGVSNLLTPVLLVTTLNHLFIVFLGKNWRKTDGGQCSLSCEFFCLWFHFISTSHQLFEI